MNFMQSSEFSKFFRSESGNLVYLNNEDSQAQPIDDIVSFEETPDLNKTIARLCLNPCSLQVMDFLIVFTLTFAKGVGLSASKFRKLFSIDSMLLEGSR